MTSSFMSTVINSTGRIEDYICYFNALCATMEQEYNNTNIEMWKGYLR